MALDNPATTSSKSGPLVSKNPGLHISPNEMEASKVEQAENLPLHAEERLLILFNQHGATWASLTDPNDPYNWPSRRKILIGVIFSIGQLVAIMSASIIVSALPSIAHDLKVSESTAQITMLSYFLGMAISPFLIAGCSEMWGRKRVWVVCTAWYVIWNALCPVGMKTGLMIVGRIMTGAGASVGTTLNGPIMADMYTERDRGRSLAIVLLLPYLGPAIGPILGGMVTQWIHWPWIFWIMSAFEALVLVIGLVLIHESYTPVLLRRKATESTERALDGRNESEKLSRLLRHLKCPLELMVQRPIIWIISLEGVISFTVYAFMLSTYATLWITRYQQSELSSSLHYISIAIGTIMTTQIGGHFMDWIYGRLSKRADGNGVPEFRLPLVMIGTLLMPIGLLWYGWSAQYHMAWIMVDTGVVIFTLGYFITAQAMNAYQLDEFADYGASANAATRLVTYVLAFVFPIFAPNLYAKLGYGWGNSVLALVVIACGVPLCASLWLWGTKLRAMGKKKVEL